MTILKLDPKALEKFIYQNKAEIYDIIEGCLLDSYLCRVWDNDTLKAVFVIYEHYVNCWTSDYIVKYAKAEHEQEQLFDEFNDRMKEQEAM